MAAQYASMEEAEADAKEYIDGQLAGALVADALRAAPRLNVRRRLRSMAGCWSQRLLVRWACVVCLS